MQLVCTTLSSVDVREWLQVLGSVHHAAEAPKGVNWTMDTALSPSLWFQSTMRELMNAKYEEELIEAILPVFKVEVMLEMRV